MRSFLFIALLLMCGCFEPRVTPSPAAHAGVGATLVSIGLYFTWAGSVAIGLGFLGGIACIFWPAVAIFRSFLFEVAALGLVAILLGTSFIWLGNNAWLLAVVVFLLLLFIGIRYRKRLGKLLGLPKNKLPPLSDQHVKG